MYQLLNYCTRACTSSALSFFTVLRSTTTHHSNKRLASSHTSHTSEIDEVALGGLWRPWPMFSALYRCCAKIRRRSDVRGSSGAHCMARPSTPRALSIYCSQRLAGADLRSGPCWRDWRGSECPRWLLSPSETASTTRGRGSSSEGCRGGARTATLRPPSSSGCRSMLELLPTPTEGGSRDAHPRLESRCYS